MGSWSPRACTSGEASPCVVSRFSSRLVQCHDSLPRQPPRKAGQSRSRQGSRKRRRACSVVIGRHGWPMLDVISVSAAMLASWVPVDPGVDETDSDRLSC